MAHSIDGIGSIPGVCSIDLIGAGPCSLLIEVPHGATKAAHFDATLQGLCGSYAADLREFFFVNTDVGAPECAWAIAELLAGSGRQTLILRALLPRTFADCNRVIGCDASRPPARR